MNWYDNLLIIAGISLDIFAAMEIEGAMLAEVRKKQLAIACTLVTLLQVGFFSGGYFICYYLEQAGVIQDVEWVGYVLATVVFGLLGLRLMVKAVKREFIHEKRREITVRGYIRIIAITTMYTLFAGCVCGLIGSNIIIMLVMIIVSSILVVIAGLYTGYHFGFASKTVAYVIGAILLWVAGVEMLVVNVMI